MPLHILSLITLINSLMYFLPLGVLGGYFAWRFYSTGSVWKKRHFHLSGSFTFSCVCMLHAFCYHPFYPGPQGSRPCRRPLPLWLPHTAHLCNALFTALFILRCWTAGKIDCHFWKSRRDAPSLSHARQCNFKSWPAIHVDLMMPRAPRANRISGLTSTLHNFWLSEMSWPNKLDLQPKGRLAEDRKTNTNETFHLRIKNYTRQKEKETWNTDNTWTRTWGAKRESDNI